MNATANLDQRLVRALELQRSGRLDEARAVFDGVLAEQPTNFVSLYSLALISLHQGKPDEALLLVDRALAVQPGFAASYALRGMALQALDRHDDALAAFNASLERDPLQSDVWINRGVLLHTMKRQVEALDSFEKAAIAQPSNANALGNAGTVLSELKRHAEAAEYFEKLLALAPDYDYGPGLLAFERRHCCDWRDADALRERIENGLRQGRRTCKTMALMAIGDNVTLHLKAAQLFAEHRYPAPATPWTPPPRKPGRIRLAYVSPDFREHPVGHLTASLFERHDRTRFEVIGVSIGIDDGSDLAKRFRAGFDRFLELRGLSTQSIVRTLRELDIDIAVDLAGYTADARTDVFAQRIARLQVNWLGYPGTLGTTYHDYLLGDRHIIPPAQRDAYSEQVVYLRDSYLPTHDGLQVAGQTPSRTHYGLPEDGFVFCSFNHDYKISPEVFAIWMDLLQEVEGSVLWLMRLHQSAQDNLRAAAAARGIDPDRLVFATRVPSVADHLARYRLADLFLDTYPYNAHTTAADALYVGLPVLTYMGHCFAGRVAGSLLHTLGVPELITDSLDAYRARALELARDPAQLAALRSRIAERRSSSPLYNTTRFSRSLETAYLRMFERQQRGDAPQSFAVDELLTLPPLVRAAELTLPPERLRIGACDRAPGWRNVYPEAAEGVDIVGTLGQLDHLPAGSVDEILLVHELNKLPQAMVVPALQQLRRLLRPNGRLLVSVPDLDVLCQLFVHPQVGKEERFWIMRMLYGSQSDPREFHLIGFNYDVLADFLAAAGFSRAERVRSFGLFKDQSEAAALGRRVSLNMIVHP